MTPAWQASARRLRTPTPMSSAGLPVSSRSPMEFPPTAPISPIPSFAKGVSLDRLPLSKRMPIHTSSAGLWPRQTLPLPAPRPLCSPTMPPVLVRLRCSFPRPNRPNTPPGLRRPGRPVLHPVALRRPLRLRWPAQPLRPALHRRCPTPLMTTLSLVVVLLVSSLRNVWQRTRRRSC